MADWVFIASGVMIVQTVGVSNPFNLLAPTEFLSVSMNNYNDKGGFNIYK